MSDYLKNLQESVIIQHSFIKSKIEEPTLEMDLRRELHGIFESKEELDLFVGEFMLSEVIVKGSTNVRLPDELTQAQNHIKYWKGMLARGDLSDSTRDKYEDAIKAMQNKISGGFFKKKTLADKAVEGGGEAVNKAKELAGEAGEKVSGAAKAAGEFAQQHGGTLAAAAAAAAAIAAGVMAYRRFFSKAARACRKAPDRKACLAQQKIKAKQAQISTINAGKAKCAKSKNPAGCKAKIDNKINAIKAKMRG